MFLRLLLSICLFFLSQALLGQQSVTATPSDGPESCPVTKPYQTSLFVPPHPYPAKAPKGRFWFGSNRLWTQLPANGTWRMMSYSGRTGTTFGDKMFWWRQGYDWRSEPEFRPKLTVTGKRLDASAPPATNDRANSGWTDPSQPFMVTGINLPTLGCWEITGRYNEDELTFIVWVAK